MNTFVNSGGGGVERGKEKSQDFGEPSKGPKKIGKKRVRRPLKVCCTHKGGGGGGKLPANCAVFRKKKGRSCGFDIRKRGVRGGKLNKKRPGYASSEKKSLKKKTGKREDSGLKKTKGLLKSGVNPPAARDKKKAG